MKFKFKHLLLATALFITPLTFINQDKADAASAEIESGIYFVNQTTNLGEYYSFEAWSQLNNIQRGQLIVKYGQQNIKAYLKPLDRIASLKDIADAQSPFLDASRIYQEKDLPGEFVNFETGEIISGGEITTSFEVTGIE